MAKLDIRFYQPILPGQKVTYSTEAARAAFLYEMNSRYASIAEEMNKAGVYFQVKIDGDGNIKGADPVNCPESIWAKIRKIDS